MPHKPSLGHDPKWKEKARRDLHGDLTRRHRTTIRNLKAEIVKLKREGVAELKALRARCSEALKKKAAGAKDWYAKQKALLLERYRARKKATHEECAAIQTRLREQVVARLAPKQAKLGEERSALAELLRTKVFYQDAFGGGRRSSGVSARQRAKEKREESDQEAEREIEVHDPALLPIWRRVKRSIHGGPHMSRAEEFLHMIHEDSSLLAEAQEAQVNSLVRDLERRQLEDYMRQHPGEVANEAEPPKSGQSRKGPPRKAAPRKDKDTAMEFFDRLARGEAA